MGWPHLWMRLILAVAWFGTTSLPGHTVSKIWKINKNGSLEKLRMKGLQIYQLFRRPSTLILHSRLSAGVIRVRSGVLALAICLLTACAGTSPVVTDSTAVDNTSTVSTSSETAGGSVGFEGYRINPEDVLEISVWKEPDLERSTVVRPDGGISFPLVGDLMAAGKTTGELTAELAQAIDAYVPGAVVSVSISEINGLRIFVTGKVRSPGEFLVGRYVDVLQALTLAGGLTPFADAKKIRILRRGNGGEQVFLFNHDQVRRGNKSEQNILLQPGDTVVVP